ncbi:6-carboxytetrahydropterin synthase QueD [Tuberibacillus sp. Marseille-P3662]|uniref:6-carboxytetrahydropterin synthase QueD n=1 Tax=Tuberibacillus sp. Marseille-P3662 TaxID=1965358 RepID=UPI000A1CA2B1|nr:6-carboxytetrahydropterin synthase QueD [Tuberibacillus sp. Marseille-P3662]
MYQIPEKAQQLGADIQRDELKYHQKRVAVTKTFTFDAAHHLHAYEGKCKNMHGHTYEVVLTMSGYTNDIGMVIDFGELKQLYQAAIANRLDHRYLNEALPPMNTTAENIVVWMWETMALEIEKSGPATNGLRLEEVTLYETPTSSATIKREWMMDHA